MLISKAIGVLALSVAVIFSSSPAMADKPSWAGEKGAKHEKKDHDRDASKGKADKVVVKEYFNDRQHVVVREYYGGLHPSGRCPPGLAKKKNGCMPPGQAKKWEIGRPIPAGVVVYPVPQPLIVQLGVPPAGYKYVRGAGDILLIAIGSMMVADAIRDLGGLS